MLEIFQYVTSGLLLYALSKLIDRVVNPIYPEGEKLKLFQRRFEIYKELYYRYCFDLSKGKEIDKEQLFIRKGDMISFYYSRYMRSDDLSELLSDKLQKKLFTFVSKQTNRNLEQIREQIANDYRIICKELHYSVRGKRYGKYDIIFLFLSLLEIVFIITTFFSFTLFPDKSLLLLILDFVLYGAMHIVSYRHFGINF